jgi:CRISPR-associated protein Cas2
MVPNKFKVGWLVVAFDLPVISKEQRKAYTNFRKFLIEDGFQMLQFSVYARPMVSHARMQTHVRRLRKNIPPEGSIRAIFVTQSQWDRSFVLYGKPPEEFPPEGLPDQLQFW